MANLDSISLAFAFAPAEVVDKYKKSFGEGEAKAYADATIIGAQTSAAEQLANLPPIPSLPKLTLPVPTTPTPTAAGGGTPQQQYAANAGATMFLGGQVEQTLPGIQQQQYANYADALSFLAGQQEQTLPGIEALARRQQQNRLAGAELFTAGQHEQALQAPPQLGPYDTPNEYFTRYGQLPFTQHPEFKGLVDVLTTEVPGTAQAADFLGDIGEAVGRPVGGLAARGLFGASPLGAAANVAELAGVDIPLLSDVQQGVAGIGEAAGAGAGRLAPEAIIPRTVGEVGLELIPGIGFAPDIARLGRTGVRAGTRTATEALRSGVEEVVPPLIRRGGALQDIGETAVRVTGARPPVMGAAPTPDDIAKLQAEIAARRQRFKEIAGPSEPIGPTVEVRAAQYGLTPDEYLGVGEFVAKNADEARLLRPEQIAELRTRQAGQSAAAAGRALEEGASGIDIARARAEAMRGGIGGPTLEISDEAAGALHRAIELDRAAGVLTPFEARRLDDYIFNARQGIRNDPSSIEAFGRWIGVQADTQTRPPRRGSRTPVPEGSRTVSEDITPGGVGAGGRAAASEEVRAALRQAQLPNTAEMRRMADALAKESTKLGAYADPAANVRRLADDEIAKVSAKIDQLLDPASAYRHPDGGGILNDAQRDALLDAYTKQRDELVAIKTSVSEEAIDRKILQNLNERVALAPGDRDTALALVSSWQDINRAVTDQIGETMHRRVGAAVASATGRTSDSYTTALVNQRENLFVALRNIGIEPDMADDIADAAVQRELFRRYPNGTPETVARALEEARRTPQTAGQELVQGLGDWSQELKNLMFGLDVGVALQQGARAGTTGFTPLVTGIINRLANAVHLGSNLYDDASLLTRSQQRTLAGVGTGRHTGIVDMADRQGTIIREFGKAGRLVDKPISAVIKNLTDFQFVKVLGTMRDLIFEGNLILARAAGADITSPAVRKTLAESANALTSYAPRAARRGRAAGERAVLLSPSMTRAQINRVSQMAKGLKPGSTTADKVVAANTIIGTALMYYAFGKVLNDMFGITDFEWDPSKPGAGLITLPDGTVWDVTPQDQLEKAMLQSVRYLAEADPEAAAKAWGRFAIGRSSPPLQAIGRAVGVGYFEGSGYQFGGAPEGRSLTDLVLDLAPIPPLATEAARGELNPTRAVLGAAGGASFPEGARGQLTRAERELGFDPFTDDPVERRRMQIAVRNDPELRQLFEESKVDYGGPSADQVKALRVARSQQEENDAALQRWRDGGDGLSPSQWREERKRIQGEYRAVLDSIYGDEEFGDPDDPVDFYYEAIRNATDPATDEVDWDAVDAFFYSMTPDDQQLVLDWLDAGDTESEKAYAQATRTVADAGWFDIRDQGVQFLLPQEPIFPYLTDKYGLPSEGFTYSDARQAMFDMQVSIQQEANPGWDNDRIRNKAAKEVDAYFRRLDWDDKYRNEKIRFMRANPEATALLLEWGFLGDPDSGQIANWEEGILVELGLWD